MAFRHEHKEERSYSRPSDWYSAEIGGYDVHITVDEDLTRLSIHPTNWQDGGRLGIFQCHPKSVGELERFADAAADLFRGIAKEMRDMGMDDLRGKWDKMRDESDAQIERMVAEIQTRAEAPEQT